MRIPLLALALASGSLATGALARQAAPTPSAASPMPMRGGMGMGGGLMRADTNGDGIITREEAVAAADARFDMLDANHDGTLTADEMRAALPPGAATPPPMPAMPPLTKQQFHDRQLRSFDRVDANHDGRIDQAEMTAYRDMMRERRQERRDGATPPSPGGQQ